MLNFATDYISGAAPKVLDALVKTNFDKTVGYGCDEYCCDAKKLILKCCGIENGAVHFLVGGTQTNSTVLDAILGHCQGVLAADSAHINVHESGAIEATGHKVITLPTNEGKISAADIDNYITNFYNDDTWEHMVVPGAVYISFPTEMGTIYSKKELTEISEITHKYNIPLFIDGARLGYGLAASKDLTLNDIATLSDIFYIGGTKVGALFGEAVVTSRPQLLPHFMGITKLHGGLLAKGRLLGVQFKTLFEDGYYFEISQHAVQLAERLKNAFLNAGFSTYMDSPTNQQFFLLPNEVIDELSKSVQFELWGARGEKETPVRFVTAWSTTIEEIEELEKLLTTISYPHP